MNATNIIYENKDKIFQKIIYTYIKNTLHKFKILFIQIDDHYECQIYKFYLYF